MLFKPRRRGYRVDFLEPEQFQFLKEQLVVIIESRNTTIPRVFCGLPVYGYQGQQESIDARGKTEKQAKLNILGKLEERLYRLRQMGESQMTPTDRLQRKYLENLFDMPEGYTPTRVKRFSPRENP